MSPDTLAAEETAVTRARADLALLDAAIEQLLRDLDAAQGAEDGYRAALQQLQRRLADRRFELQRAKQDEADAEHVADLSVRVDALTRLIPLCHADRQQWVAAHSVQAFDPSGRPVTKSLTTVDISHRLGMVRAKRADVAVELAEAEAAQAAAQADAAPAEGR